MKKIFAFLISALVITACTNPFDDTSIWDKLNEHENKINDIENDVNGSGDTNNSTGIPDGAVSNKIYYTTADGKKMFPYSAEPSAFGAILVSNIYENGIGILTFDDDIISIGNSAFNGCSGLTSVTIPNSVTSIGSGAFYNCSGLTSITIPNSVTSIEDYAFEGCSGLTSFTIPNSVTSIGGSAFEGCSGLTSIKIPNSVTSIGYRAFLGCSGLKEVHINDLSAWCNIGFGSSEANPLYYGAKLYLNGELVTDLVIPDDVKEIKSSAFYNYSGLTSITIPNSVTSIGSYAFDGCTSLKYLRIEDGENILSLGYGDSSGLFNDCPLETLYLGRDLSYTSYSGGARSPFNAITTLTSVTVGNSVTSIGEIAFKDCSGLKEVHINDLSAWCNISFNGYSANPLCYAKNLYLNGKLVTNLVIPDDVKEIKKYAFYNCRGLTSITIPNSVTSIGGSAFEGCSGLTSVTIPNSVTSIGSSAFEGCSGLMSITIPNNVTSIGSYAFYNCSGLYMVHINNLDAWNNISFDDYYANPLNNSNAKLYLNGVEVK